MITPPQESVVAVAMAAADTAHQQLHSIVVGTVFSNLFCTPKLIGIQEYQVACLVSEPTVSVSWAWGMVIYVIRRRG